MNIKVNASLLEDGLVEELQDLINKNKELFEDSKVALMPDAHKTGGIPVGFTMTVPHYRVAPDFISSDVSCGVTSVLLEDFVPTDGLLRRMKRLARDIIQIDRTLDEYYDLTDLGTLGSGNHFTEVGTDGKDTLISVHSGSRSVGGQTFNKWKQIAKDQYKEERQEITRKMLKEVEPQDRQEWLKKHKLPTRNIHYVDLSNEELRNEFIKDYENANNFAIKNRLTIIKKFIHALNIGSGTLRTINTTHNYIDFDEFPWVIRKGSIKAINGEHVVIPINMRDGIILGTVTERGEFNNSLPHGAGRILSRTAAFNELNLEDFKEDMKDVSSPTILQATLDESPRAYKDIETILTDIGDGLEYVRIFKSVFNYKGVE